MWQIGTGWNLQLDSRDGWLLAGLLCMHDDPDGEPSLADGIMAATREYGTTRVVFEFDNRAILHSFLVGQLIMLSKRLHLEGGVLRVCALSPENYEVLRLMRLADRFPNYPDREAAMQNRPRP